MTTETYVLRIDELQPGGYPVTLFHAATPNATLASTVIPKNLKTGSKPLTGTQMLEKIRTQDSADPAFLQMGRQLYALLTSGGVKAVLRQKLQGEARLLLDVGPEVLRRLPWETMVDDTLFTVFRSLDQPWSRGNLDAPPALGPIELPLRVLVIVGSRPNDPAVCAEDEVRAVIDALHEVEPQVDLWVERQPVRDWIKKRFDPDDLQPHVLHFIGHGDVQSVAGGLDQGVLQLTHRPGEAEDEIWNAATITNDFRTGSKPRLVILNACRTGEASDRGLQFSVADAFLNAGVPAVISMGGEVTGKDATAFSQRLYAALASTTRQLPLDAAVARARDEVFGLKNPPLDYRDWALPMLDLRAPPDQIVQVPAGRSDLLPEVKGAAFYKYRRSYVDRREARSDLWVKLRQRAADYRAYAIVGERGSGKSALAHLLVERCLIAGHEARYVNFDNSPGITVLDLLKGIVEGVPVANFATRLTSPLPDPAFSVFRDRVQGVSPMDLAKDNTRQAVFAAFKEGLVALSGACPVTLVIDQLGWLNEGDPAVMLSRELLDWTATGLHNPIRIVFVLNPAQRLVESIKKENLIPTPLFCRADWPMLPNEFANRIVSARGIELTGDQRAAIDLLIQATGQGIGSQERWFPAVLKRLRISLLVNLFPDLIDQVEGIID